LSLRQPSAQQSNARGLDRREFVVATDPVSENNTGSVTTNVSP
jgi:hypothetical protein